MGSSSAFTVGLINAIAALRGHRIGRHDLASEAIRIEQHVIGEAVGSQDQIWAAFGGLNRIDFNAFGFVVRPLVLPPARVSELLSHLMLFFTGFQRTAAEIEVRKIGAMRSIAPMLHTMQHYVDEAESILASDQDIISIGLLLDRAWAVKRLLASGVSTSAIDEVYERAKSAGAMGGKLLGAGGGGFLLLFVAPEKQPAVRAALSSMIEVPVEIDREGSRVVVYEPALGR
jgi:D-glycero-alpha-D-manno-heptose-7-phosphate kinase